MVNTKGKGIIDTYREFIVLSRYAKWIENKGRRESWRETVTRTMDWFKEYLERTLNYKISVDFY